MRAAQVRLLLDDHEVVRRGVRDLLEAEEGFSVVGEASTCAQALVRIPALRPQVAVLDIMDLVGDGMTIREIGSALFLAEKTVKNHISRILAELGIERRLQAATLVGRDREDERRVHP